MNVEIGTEAPIFLFWEYLFQIFGILSLQCISLAFPNGDEGVYFNRSNDFYLPSLPLEDWGGGGQHPVASSHIFTLLPASGVSPRIFFHLEACKVSQ